MSLGALLASQARVLPSYELIVAHAAGLFVASGVIFGAAMVGVGKQVLLAAAKAPGSEASSVDPKTAR